MMSLSHFKAAGKYREKQGNDKRIVAFFASSLHLSYPF